ncbi:MAG: hypothetical protein KKB70_01180 [Proteobacteria bacterium]|nr:hypothetical protein [Pseudomonadota bacterium]MBU1611597.1 hypothetical protein [Pseudomonadota bacterium]
MLWRDDSVAIGLSTGLIFFGLLVWKYRFRLSWPQMIFAAVFGGAAVYHIVWVIWGGGRTGWP